MPGEATDGRLAVLEFLFPSARYINIVRRDRRAQAISYYRALLSNEWVRRPTEAEQFVPSQPATARIPMPEMERGKQFRV